GYEPAFFSDDFVCFIVVQPVVDDIFCERTIGKGAAPVRAHGPLAGKTIIHIDDSPLLMRTGSYAAAHMAYDNIYVPVFFIHRFRILSCYRFLVKRMDDVFPLYPFTRRYTPYISE